MLPLLLMLNLFTTFLVVMWIKVTEANVVAKEIEKSLQPLRSEII